MAEGSKLGFESGRAEAIQQFTDKLEQLTVRWSDSLDQWNRERQRMLDEAREDVIRFAFELGRKVVHRLAAGDPTVIQDQLRESLAILTRPSALSISVHPRDRELAEQVLPQLIAAIGGSAHASLRDDTSIDRGGCVIVTESGRIDSTIQKQLERIAEALVPDAPPLTTAEVIDSVSNDGVSNAPDDRAGQQ